MLNTNRWARLAAVNRAGWRSGFAMATFILLTIWSWPFAAMLQASPQQPPTDTVASDAVENSDGSLDKLDETGFSQLHYFAMHNKPIEAMALIERGADVNVQQGTFQGTPLQYAAHKGRIEVMKVLIEREARLDAADSFGRTPLMWAAHGGQAKSVELLIAAGADVNAKTKTGWTALMYASQTQDRLSKKLLLDAGATVAPAKAPDVASVRKTMQVPSDSHAMFSSPQPFLSPRSDGSKQPLKWSDLPPTELDVNVRVLQARKTSDGQIILEIEISNGEDQPVRTYLTKEWHGGEWPPTDLYASVTPVGRETMSRFVPVYLQGESQNGTTLKKIRPGKKKLITLRMDWPGTGSVKAEPLMSDEKATDYFVSVMMVFEFDRQPQYTISKLRQVSTNPPANRDNSIDAPEQAGLPLTARDAARRREAYRNEIEFLTIPAASIPAGFHRVESLPAVVIPTASSTDDAFFDIVSAFIGTKLEVRKSVKAAIIVGLAGDERPGSEIGVYAVCCKSEEAARKLFRPGLIQKKHLLLYLWADDAAPSAVDSVRKHFVEKEFVLAADD